MWGAENVGSRECGEQRMWGADETLSLESKEQITFKFGQNEQIILKHSVLEEQSCNKLRMLGAVLA